MLSTDVDTRDNICTASLWRYVSWCYSKHQIGSSRHQDRAEQFETSLPIEKEKRRCIVSHLCAIIFELGWQIGFVMKVFGSQSNCRRHWRRRRQQKKKATRKKKASIPRRRDGGWRKWDDVIRGWTKWGTCRQKERIRRGRKTNTLPCTPLSGSKFKTNETKARELRLDSRMSANLESTPRIWEIFRARRNRFDTILTFSFDFIFLPIESCWPGLDWNKKLMINGNGNINFRIRH